MPKADAQGAADLLCTRDAPDRSESASSQPARMTFALVHLSGPRRGHTQYFDQAHLLLGSDPRADLAFSPDGDFPVAPLQAELYQSECRVRLRNLEPASRTLVNDRPVDDVALADRDLIQLGPKGPTLRFRIRSAEYARCKKLREMLADARDVAGQGRLDGRASVGLFMRQLAYELRRNAPLLTQLAVLGLLVVLIGVVAGFVYYTYTIEQAHQRQIDALLKELQESRLSEAELIRRMNQERRRLAETLAAHEAETNRVLALLEEQRQKGAPQQEIQALAQRLKTLETERTTAEVLIKRYGPSVCFLYLAYGFAQKGSPEPPSVLLEYTGTGFLVDAEGLMVTNRHMTEPWTMDPRATADMVKAGLEPKLVALRAYFPGRPEPYDVSLVRLSDRGDVAIGRLSPIPEGIAPIMIRRPPPRGIPGEAVVVLGYPAGIEGILARIEDKAAVALLKGADHSLQKLVQEVANQAAIRPLATQGHISDVVPNRIIYDAQTTSGGSGSPVFDSHGEVIAVHSAIMTRFGAIGFGVPVDAVLELLAPQSER
jgi:S1-C subfamily serine protease